MDPPSATDLDLLIESLEKMISLPPDGWKVMQITIADEETKKRPRETRGRLHIH